LLFVRPWYTQSTNDANGQRDVIIRNQLGAIADEHTISAADWATLLNGVDHYHLDALVLRSAAPPPLGPSLKSLGFSVEDTGNELYYLWTRRKPQ
jgi:hypothetical protein